MREMIEYLRHMCFIEGGQREVYLYFRSFCSQIGAVDRCNYLAGCAGSSLNP